MRENKKSKDTGIPTALLRVTSWVVVFCAFLYATTVHADNGPHGGYTAATDACAGCHRAHTAATETLLLNTVPDLCYTCHGSSAAGADTNVVDGTYDGLESGSGEGVVDHGLKGGGVQNALMDTDVLTTTTATITATTSSHMVDGSTGTLWGSGSITSTFYAGLTDFSLSCISCHNPHGGGTYRILRPIPTDSGASDPVIVDDEVSKNYTVSASDNTYMGQTYGGISPQLANWCSQCHTRYLADSGSGHTDSGDTIYKYRHTTTSVSCVQCHVAHGSSAKMGTFSGAVLWPDNTIAPSGDSRSSLLRLDSRGVCAYCHLNQLGNVGGGSCDSCHNLPQGDRRAVVPDGTNPNDFGNTSHHVNGPVQNSDCTVCHYTGNHMGGIVNLNDPDGGNIYSFDPGNPAALEIFCLNCHDTDGALAFGGTRPFSDGQLVPDIEGSEIKTQAHRVLCGQIPPIKPKDML